MPSPSPQPSEVLLEAQSLRVEFGPLVAVQNLSFELRAGHLLGLIGPNGAGKTTLLRALAGMQPLAAGRVRAMGVDVLPGAIPALRHIGFTPDNPGVYEDLTVREFLEFIARGYCIDLDEARARTAFWLQQVWLSEKVDQKIKTLSRGMRQRIGLARTLLPSPAVILLDEPAAGLDPAGRVQFRRLLCALRDQGKAIIVSSHILADMNEYCTHIAIMAHGSFMQHGTVAQVAASDNHERCRYIVRLARPVDGLTERLTAIEGITLVDVQRDAFDIDYSSDRADAAQLLARFIQEGLPVAAFEPQAPGLEEAYLRAGIRQVD